jgi:hypothetical protein
VFRRTLTLPAHPEQGTVTISPTEGKYFLHTSEPTFAGCSRSPFEGAGDSVTRGEVSTLSIFCAAVAFRTAGVIR